MLRILALVAVLLSPPAWATTEGSLRPAETGLEKLPKGVVILEQPLDDEQRPVASARWSARTVVIILLALAGSSMAFSLALLRHSGRRRQALTDAAEPQPPWQPQAVLSSSHDRPRPWIRFWARLLDIADFSLFVALGLHLAKSMVALPGVGARSAVAGLVLLLAWVMFEAVLLATWGTTPGKWLLKISIERRDGAALDFASALRRSFAVWLKGLGCGLPVISLFTLVIAWQRLREKAETSWDRDGGFVIGHEDIGILRGLAAMMAFASIAAVWLTLERDLS